MNNLKDVFEEIEEETRMVCKLREIGFGLAIDNAVAAVDRGEITDEQYWAYIRGLYSKVVVA
jgi:hypothetical protein